MRRAVDEAERRAVNGEAHEKLRVIPLNEVLLLAYPMVRTQTANVTGGGAEVNPGI